MITTAREIQNACQVGMLLVGDEEGRPQWLGTSEQWSEYEKLQNTIEA